METNERNVYDVLEPEENIIWQGNPDVKKGVLTEYVKVFVLVLAMGMMGGISVSLLGKIFASNNFIIALPIIISVLALFSMLVKQVPAAFLAKGRYSAESYIVTDRRILIKNQENPEWFSVSYPQIRHLETYELALSFEGNIRTINIIMENNDQDIVCMNHVENWREVCMMIYSQKRNVPMEEIEINNDFFHHMAKNRNGRGYHRIYFWA